MPFENRENELDEEIIYADLADADKPTLKPSKRTFIEQVLSPQSLQWMMGCGGGILVLGFVIWLWSVGIFENPMVVAAGVGGVTIATIAAGISMVRLTRYQLAGRWLTLLGALALPLNLWLYDAQGLITLANGGHLWIPAAVCCFIYAGIARTLKDATFVYTFVGGIVLTGMLFLADESVGRFWDLFPAVTFLLSIGWMSVFSQRLFIDNEGEFSRKKFGLAFQRSGMVVVASGLALLFGSQLFAALNHLMLDQWLPTIDMNGGQKVWALTAILISAIGFGVQGVVQRYRNYHLVAAGLLSWAVLLSLNLFAIQVTVSSIATLLAGMVLLANVYVAAFSSREAGHVDDNAGSLTSSIGFGSHVVTAILAITSVIQVVFQVLQADAPILGEIGWASAFQYFLTALAALVVGRNSMIQKNRSDNSTTSMIVVGFVLLSIAAWNVGIVAGLATAPWFGLALGAIPLSLAIIGTRQTAPRLRHATKLSASIGISTVLALLAASITQSELVWATCLALASAVYTLASSERTIGVSRILGFVSATASISMFGHCMGFNFGYCLILAPMLLGTAMKVFDSAWLKGEVRDGELQATQFGIAANLLILGSGAASVLLAMSRWLESDTGGPLIYLVLATLGCTTLASLLTRDSYWRTVFRALIVAMVGSFICVFDGLLDMNGWHRAEVCSLLGGGFLLMLGHVAWSREKDGELDAAATLSLLLGCLLIVLPMISGLLFYRMSDNSTDSWRLFHEVGSISAGLLLFGSGVLCRIRSTTLAGGSLLALFVVSLATLIRLPDQLQSVSIMMMVGGGAFFGTALLMSIYRDRLASLPKRIREGDGVYRVLKWR